MNIFEIIRFRRIFFFIEVCSREIELEERYFVEELCYVGGSEREREREQVFNRRIQRT